MLADRYKDGTHLERTQSWHVQHSPWKARHIERLLARNHMIPATIADVGCGGGEIIRQLSLNHPNTRYVGYELSPQAFELCRTRESERVRYRCENILDADAHYDCLLCIDVFEHVEDYMGFLRGLKPKAEYKIFHIPLDISLWSVLGRSMAHARHQMGHLHYFTYETAIATLSDCGYEIVDGFFTPAFEARAARTLRGKIANTFRSLLFKMAPHWCARLLGHCSYMVLTK